MSLEELHPVWRYIIFREITKETDWERFKKKCPYYELVYERCSRINTFCSYKDSP